MTAQLIVKYRNLTDGAIYI